MLLLSFLWFELTLGAVSGTHEVWKSWHEVQQFSQVHDRINMMERFLRHQAAKLSHQETLLRQQDAKLIHQQTLLRQQDAELSHQKLLIRELKKKDEYNHIMHPQQVDKISYSEGLLYQSEPRRHEYFRTRTFHDDMSRADDSARLTAVLSQISQEVTELGAEVQAYKAQTKADLQALQATTKIDIHDVKMQTRTDFQSFRNETIAEIQSFQNQTSADILMLKNKTTQKINADLDSQGSTFVRWGSSTCGDDSQLIYSGYVGGSYYDHTGAATNYQCLTTSPVLSKYPPYGANVALVFGTEYETHDAKHNQDALCAMCRVNFSTTVMIPGTSVCTPGWHLQYSGYLMAGYYDYEGGSEYVCVDAQLASRDGSRASVDSSSLLHYVISRCGSLPCPPYANGKVVSCAVCSR